MSIYETNVNLPDASRINLLNDMIIELNGTVAQGKFDINELTQIYTDISLDREYRRNILLGNTLTTYGNWTHVKAEDGYSIWKITPTDYTYDSLNNLYFDDKVLENRGEADSEIATAFDFVYLYNGDSGSGYIDNTAEASTEEGTAFDVMDTTADYLYLGEAATFSAAKFEWATRGSYYNLVVEYYNGASGDGWTTMTADLNDLEDDTSNFESDGRIHWTTPGDWVTTTVNSETKYWIRISTSQTPVSTASCYYLIPGDSVIAKLAMSNTEVLEETWCWCTYNDVIYTTIRNIGNAAYEGNYYITSSSTTTNKQNFFIYNHTYKSDYKDSTYIPGGAGGVSGYYQPPVETKGETSAPSGPADGDRYLIITGDSGDWFGYDDYITQYNATNVEWDFIEPLEGMITFLKDEDAFYVYYGSAWHILSSGGGGGGITWQDAVASKDISDAPSGPSDGDRYIVAATPASGDAWYGETNNIAEYDTVLGWQFTTALEGMAAYVDDINEFYMYTGSVWQHFGMVLDYISDADGDTQVETERTTDDDTIYMKSAGTDVVTVTTAGISVYGDTDTVGGITASRAKIGMPTSGASDYAYFGHLDGFGGSSGYALCQGTAGDTYLNSASGQRIRFSVAAGEVGAFESTGVFQLTQNSDTLSFTGDGSDWYQKWSNGSLYLQTTETNTNVYAKGNGGNGLIGAVHGDGDRNYLYHDGEDAYHKWDDGALYLQTNEGTNTSTDVIIKGKGTGSAILRLRDGSSDLYNTNIYQQDDTFVISYSSSVTSFVINEDGADVDFRVEGDTVTDLFKVDAGTDTVSIGGGATSSIKGSLYFSDGTYNRIQILPYSADALYMTFDMYFDGTNFKSQDAGSNFDIRKSADALSINSDFGIAVGSNVTVDSRLKFNATESIFNEGGVDVDFRVESDTKDSIFFVNAGANRIAIGDRPSSSEGLINISSAGATTSNIMYMENFSADTGYTNNIYFRKSASNTAGTKVDTATTETLGNITAYGVTSTNWSIGATLSFVQDGAGDTNRIPVNTVFANNSGVNASNNIETLRLGADEVIVNEDGADVDFRVEGVGQANALFVRGSDGNVGMGTTTPQSALSVVGNVQVEFDSTGTGAGSFLIKDDNGTTNIGGFIHYGATNVTLPDLLLIKNYVAGGGIRLAPNGGSVSVLDIENDSMVINETGVDVDFRVEAVGHPNSLFVRGSDGNIGIGTDTPSQKLEIASGSFIISDGDMIVTSAGAGDRANIVLNSFNENGGVYDSAFYFRKSANNDGTTESSTADGEKLGEIIWQGVNGAGTPAFSNGAIIHAIQDGSAGASYVPTNLIFETWGTAKNSNQLVLHNDGKVGIGTDSPATLLSLSASAGNNGITYTYGSAEAFLGDASGEGRLSLKNSSGTENVRLSSYSSHDSWIICQKVGIGTNAPVSQLEISESNTSADRQRLTITNEAAGGYGSWLMFQATQNFGSNLAVESGGIKVGGESNYSSDANTDSYMSFWITENNSITERMKISSAGVCTWTQNSDTFTLTGDGGHWYQKWSNGYLKLATDEGTDTSSVVQIIGKGTGQAYLSLIDGGNAQYYTQFQQQGAVASIVFGTSTSSLVINENGTDTDLRVETENVVDALVVDAGDDKVTFGVDVELGNIEIEEDAGAVTLVNMSVTSTPAAGTEESYAFQIDDTTIFKVYAEADNAGGIQNAGLVLENGAMIANVVNDDIDTGTETVDTFADTLGDAVVWHYVVKNGTDLRAGTVTACWEAAGDTVEYTEVSTNDIGDTSDLTFSVDISSDYVRLLAGAASDDWEVRVIRNLI